ncbi:MAG: glutamine-hydrolyzing carbamoyl-phosphate synthase small subunit [Candidatus Marinimicrobia bacterium]|nr:glutamine-hydrolyzing carbamoyl-phosphate synthase small subunit [Candidatus Neomarinimicrobiota bacterium]
MQLTQPAILFLEDGLFFNGFSFGATGETTGEVCFNTGMTGYQEVLTDPSYCRQIVTMTSPHIGNYGINPQDVESDRIQVAGFAIKVETDRPSHWRSTQSVGDYLREHKIVGIKQIDTRALTRHIRDAGAMRGIISTTDFDTASLAEKLAAFPEMTGRDLAAEVSCRKSYGWTEQAEDDPAPRHKVIAVDFGIKRNILRLLTTHGCDVTVVPADTGADEILASGPDGVFLSNGPGDPAAVTYAIDTVGQLLGKVPLFGICLGHQILALALGAKTYKLKFGHRGLNHPVKNLATGIIEITSQNHGFTVDTDTLPGSVEPTHINLNDDTLEGLRCSRIPAFSVQYHPEASPGTHDARYLFKDFSDLMENNS